MIEAKFHLFQIQEKVAAPDSVISPQLCFGEHPETLNTVDVIPSSGKFPLHVIDPVMPVAVGEESVIRSERIRVNRASFRNLLFDDKTRELRTRHRVKGGGMDPSIPPLP